MWGGAGDNNPNSCQTVPGTWTVSNPWGGEGGVDGPPHALLSDPSHLLPSPQTSLKVPTVPQLPPAAVFTPLRPSPGAPLTHPAPSHQKSLPRLWAPPGSERASLPGPRAQSVRVRDLLCPPARGPRASVRVSAGSPGPPLCRRPRGPPRRCRRQLETPLPTGFRPRGPRAQGTRDWGRLEPHRRRARPRGGARGRGGRSAQ